MSKPDTKFDWAVYADATFAGLSVLIPVPFVDSFFEFWFRTRIPRAVAKRREQTLEPAVVVNLNTQNTDYVKACLLLPVTLTFGLLKRASKKALYFLTVKEAADKLSYFWHFAFLVDYALLEGHLAGGRSSQLARRAIDQVLGDVTTSPLVQLAQQVVTGTRHIFSTLRGARRGAEDEVIEERRSIMKRAWESFGTYFVELADHYDRAFVYLEGEAERVRAERVAHLAAMDRAAEAPVESVEGDEGPVVEVDEVVESPAGDEAPIVEEEPVEPVAGGEAPMVDEVVESPEESEVGDEGPVVDS